MPYSFLFLDEVLVDIQEAKFWYKQQKAGLEISFANVVQEAISKLILSPKAYAIRYKNIRIAHTKIFPYNIHFYINQSQKQVIIIGIVHNRKNPKKTSKRIS